MATRCAPHSSFVMAAGFSLALFAPAMVAAQPAPPAPGRVIEAADGDVIVVRPSSRVAIVRRLQGQGRLSHAADRGGLLLVMEPVEPAAGIGAGGKWFRSWMVGGEPWPLGARWDGAVTIDEYLPSGSGGPGGLAIHTDRGSVFIGHLSDFPISPAPMAVLRPNGMRAGSVWGTFEEIEQLWLAGGDEALSQRQRLRGATVIGGTPHPDSSVSFSAGAATATRSAAAAVRVGGNVRAPSRLNQVEPVYPQQAKDARVQGVVILEIVVGADGAVSDARVLRSIPLLDEAALECVRQWRYEPTLLNGAPVPIVMTATVNFTLNP
jgi:TonB family protein